MNPRLLTSLSVVVLSAASLSAQLTSPPGYLSTEGAGWQGVTTYGYAYYMGGYADGRFQFMDGDIKQNGTTVLTSIGFRRDDRTYSSTLGVGRSWTNVHLQLSEGDISQMTRTWTANSTRTPTTVFTGSMSWPTITGASAGSPNPWDPALRTTFSAPYIYTASGDLLCDWDFSGGTLSNGTTWGTNLRTYYLDGNYVLTSTTYGRNVYRTNNNNCVDSAITTTTSYASASVQVGLYGPLYTSNPAYTNTAQLQVFGYRTAPGALVLQAIGLSGSSTGVNIGAKCNNLMIDMTKPTVIIADTTNNNSSASRTWQYIRLGTLSALAPLGTSTPIWSQGAWTDSVTNQFALTACDRCTADFGRKFNSTMPNRKVLYTGSATSTTGSGPYDASRWYAMPITRYN